MIKHVKWSDQGLFAQSMDCVPSDSQEGQLVEKTSIMAMASEAPNIHLTPLLGPESLEGNSRHGLKARDSGFPSRDYLCAKCLFSFPGQVRRKQ